MSTTVIFLTTGFIPLISCFNQPEREREKQKERERERLTKQCSTFRIFLAAAPLVGARSDELPFPFGELFRRYLSLTQLKLDIVQFCIRDCTKRFSYGGHFRFLLFIPDNDPRSDERE